MNCKILINIIGKFNHYNILAAMNFKPATVVIVRMKEDLEVSEKAKASIMQSVPDVCFVEHVLPEQSWEAIKDVIGKYNSEDTYINLSGGNKLISLLALQAAQGRLSTPIYIDNDEGEILKLKGSEVLSEPLHIKLTVEDIVNSTGAEILKHSTEMFDKPEYKLISNYIIKNYKDWQLVKSILRCCPIIQQSPNRPLQIEILTYDFDKQQLGAMEGFLKELTSIQLINSYNFYLDYLQFTFATREAKSFIMTAGSWLEAITYNCISELKEVSSAISGMLFVWDEEVQVHNELDVVAAVDSHLICISCKDTEKYDVEDLNELEVYSDHLGGRKVTKILVSTQAPERGQMILQRAEEMGIKIVIFDGNVSSFKLRLHEILIS